jgi:hypothetical protein
MIGLGPWPTEISENEARELAALGSGDPAHPSWADYQKMADNITADIANQKARYINPLKDCIKPLPSV